MPVSDVTSALASLLDKAASGLKPNLLPFKPEGSPAGSDLAQSLSGLAQRLRTPLPAAQAGATAIDDTFAQAINTSIKLAFPEASVVRVPGQNQIRLTYTKSDRVPVSLKSNFGPQGFLSFTSTGSAELELKREIDLTAGFDQSTGSVYLVTDSTQSPEVKVTASAFLTKPGLAAATNPTQLNAKLGFINVIAKDKPQPTIVSSNVPSTIKTVGTIKTLPLNASAVGQQAGSGTASSQPATPTPGGTSAVGIFTIDLIDKSGPDDKRVPVSDLGNTSNYTAELNANVNVNLNLKSDFDSLLQGLPSNLPFLADLKLPSVSADLLAAWGIKATNLLSGSPVLTNSTPSEINLKDVKIDLGSLQKALDFIRKIGDYVDKAKPIADLFTQRIDALSLLGPDAPKTLIGMLESKQIVNPTTAQTVRDLAARMRDISQAANNLSGLSGTRALGDFSISLPSSPQGSGTTSSSFSQSAISRRGQAPSVSLPPYNANAAIRFPILDPSKIGENAVKLLLGQDVDLFTAKAPPLAINIPQTRIAEFPIPNPFGLPLNAFIEGRFKADVNLGLGYDTSGIRSFLQNQATQPLNLLDGLYIADPAGDELSADVGLTIGGELNVAGFAVGVDGTIDGDLGIDLRDANNDQKLRIGEFVGLASNPLAAFEFSGDISLSAGVFARTPRIDFPVSIPAQRWRRDTPELVLLDLGILNTDVPPATPSASNGSGSTGTGSGGTGSSGSSGSGSTSVLPRKPIASASVVAGQLKYKPSIAQIVGNAAPNAKGLKIIASTRPSNNSLNMSVAVGRRLEGQNYTGLSKVDLELPNANNTIRFDNVRGVALKVVGGTGVDRIAGGDRDDDIAAGPGNDFVDAFLGRNLINAGDGFDYILSGAGVDQIAGGAGFDVVSYRKAASAVVIDLASSKFDGAVKGGSLVDVEQVEGTPFADRFVGSARDDVFYGLGAADDIDGGDGNDFLDGGAAGDRIVGGAGYDLAGYTRASTSVIASLEQPSLNKGDAQGDSYLLVEGLSGSPFADKLFGDANSNQLLGMDGDDELFGGLSNDVIDGGAGNDALIGCLAKAGGGSGEIDFLNGSLGDDSFVLGARGSGPFYASKGNADFALIGDFGFASPRSALGADKLVLAGVQSQYSVKPVVPSQLGIAPSAVAGRTDLDFASGIFYRSSATASEELVGVMLGRNAGFTLNNSTAMFLG